MYRFLSQLYPCLILFCRMYSRSSPPVSPLKFPLHPLISSLQFQFLVSNPSNSSSPTADLVLSCSPYSLHSSLSSSLLLLPLILLPSSPSLILSFHELGSLDFFCSETGG
ncbi:unnamed protein product [Cuscuta europaea]|uniref:Uncharacterized protein n=1 Tax=Cuscuta europaea TaxID=41803 RepID=A0A9P1E3U4_CUSEU|nr:unnamed protein product [Cuscuta europaea]